MSLLIDILLIFAILFSMICNAIHLIDRAKASRGEPEPEGPHPLEESVKDLEAGLERANQDCEAANEQISSLSTIAEDRLKLVNELTEENTALRHQLEDVRSANQTIRDELQACRDERAGVA